ncbi:hypothetical protein BCD67_06325 [Oscillatoriales cyanobacterium USR001]|nr:hypothetical protein BCD67_06325 [Oscillatoriales cyanobacterium USR001]
MKAYEFPAKVTAEGKIELPYPIVKQLLDNQEVRVIVLVNELIDLEEDDETQENAAWHRLAAEQLLAGYSEEDAISG